MSNTRPVAVSVRNVKVSFYNCKGLLELCMTAGWFRSASRRLGLWKKSREQKLVLADINYDFHQGSMVAIIGFNAAGKSTLLDCICGLLKPTAGEIFVYGKPVSAMPENIRTLISRSSREGAYKLFTAKQNIEFITGINKLDSKEAWNVAYDLLTKLGMNDNDLVKTHYGSLNTGGKVKVGLVCSLLPLVMKQHAADTGPILLLDEPTANLDVVAVHTFFDTIAQIRKVVPNLTIILATNDPREATECDECATICEKHLVTDPTAFEDMKRLMSAYKPVVYRFAELLGGKKS